MSPPLSLADEWAGGALALIVGGSHAAGTDVWVTLAGRRLCLSDLDVYAVVPDRAAQSAALERMRADRPRLRERLLSWGMAAPLEVAFLVPEDLAQLPPRPATLELKRRGLVVKGDPSWLDRVPSWDPGDVSDEEIQLLLENRAFELLDARPGLAAAEELVRCRARHAVLKGGLDVVRVAALAAGTYPEDAAGLVAWAAHSAAPLPAPLAPAFHALLDAALGWRAGRVEALDPVEGRREWRTAASAWVAAWRGRIGPSYRDALRAARRAPLKRRLKRSLFWPVRSGCGPSLSSRLTHALRGTPQHRVNAAAAILLLASVEQEDAAELRLPAGARAALAMLGVADPAALADWERAARAVVRAWDCWVLDGQRTGEPA